MLKPVLVDHLVFRVAHLERTERFYTSLLGAPQSRDAFSLMFFVGETRLFFTLSPHEGSEAYDKERVGLNHLAFRVSTIEELNAVDAQLSATGLQHSGVQVDRYGLKEFLWLDDPDGMRLEFYQRTQ